MHASFMIEIWYYPQDCDNQLFWAQTIFSTKVGSANETSVCQIVKAIVLYIGKSQ